MKRLWTMVLLLAMMTLSLAAQVHAQPPRGPMDEEKLRQRIEMISIWKLTEMLNLDEDRAAVFFPRYKGYLNDVDTLMQKQRRVDNALEDAIEKGSNDFDKLFAMSVQLDRDVVEHRIQFIEGTSDLLSEKEQAALLLFERRFQHRLQQMVMDVQREHGPPGGGNPNSPGRGWRGGQGKDGP